MHEGVFLSLGLLATFARNSFAIATSERSGSGFLQKPDSMSRVLPMRPVLCGDCTCAEKENMQKKLLLPSGGPQSGACCSEVIGAGMPRAPFAASSLCPHSLRWQCRGERMQRQVHMSGNDSAINASGLRSATRRKPAVCFTAEIAQFDVRLVSPVTTGPSGQPEG